MIDCTCGETADHIIARRSTADGKHVCLWSDGSLTWALGYAIKGAAHPRTPEQRRRGLKAGRLVLGEVCLYDGSEVEALVRAARWAADRDGLPGTMRARLHRTRPTLRPTWTVTAADRNGRPTTRVWRLPRLSHPGTAIWHERGWYELAYEQGRSGTFVPSGIKARSLGKVLSALRGGK